LKNEVKILSEQIKIIEGLEHAKARLAVTSSLESNTLSKCDVFMRYVNSSPYDSGFYLEVCKLSLDELAFSSISFEERRLKSIVYSFTASAIRDYMTSSQVLCLNRPEIFTRLRHLSNKTKGTPFHEVYMTAQSVHGIPTKSALIQSDEQINDGTGYKVVTDHRLLGRKRLRLEPP